MLTEDMKRVVREQRLCFAATVSADGTPNLSPKGTILVWDDEHLAFADLRSPGTVANLRRNPAIELNVVDPIGRRGYRFKGTAAVHESGEVLEEARRRLDLVGYGVYGERMRTAVVVHVESAAELLSPAYDLGTSEAELRRQWLGHYESLERAAERTA